MAYGLWFKFIIYESTYACYVCCYYLLKGGRIWNKWINRETDIEMDMDMEIDVDMYIIFYLTDFSNHKYHLYKANWFIQHWFMAFTGGNRVCNQWQASLHSVSIMWRNQFIPSDICSWQIMVILSSFLLWSDSLQFFFVA